MQLSADDIKFKYGKPENVLKVYRIAQKAAVNSILVDVVGKIIATGRY